LSRSTLALVRRFGRLSTLDQARLQFLNATAELFDFTGIRRWWPRVSCQQVPYEIERARYGTLGFRNPDANCLLRLLVEIERAVQVPGHEFVCGPVGCLHELPQELQGQSCLPGTSVLHYDLGEGHRGQVLAGASVHHLNVDAIPHHARDIVELYITARAGIVQSPVAVFSDDYFGLFHFARSKGSHVKAQSGRDYEACSAGLEPCDFLYHPGNKEGPQGLQTEPHFCKSLRLGPALQDDGAFFF